MKFPAQKRLKTAIYLALVAGLAGCGQGNKLSPAPTTTSGVAVDGLLSGMFCYADINENAIYDQNIDVAASGLTDALGNYSITGVGTANSPTVCRAESGAKDQATGESFSGQLSAPPGVTTVSPVTTLIVALGGDAAAESQARAILGLDSSVDLLSNPLDNPNLAKAAAKIQSIVSVITKSLSSQLGTTDQNQQNAIAAEAYKAIANSFSGQTNGLNDSTALTNAINATTQAVSSSSTNSSAAELTNAVEDILNNIDSEYQAAIDSGDAFTADQLNTAQSNSASDSAIDDAFTDNSVSIQDDSLTVNENLVIDNSESPAGAPQKPLYSSDGNDDPETFQGEFPLSDFGNGATFDAGVTTDTSFDRVFSVTSGEGYGAGVHVAFVAFLNYSEGFTKGFDSFNAKVKGSPSNQVEVKFFGDNSVESAINIDLTTYEGATDIGNGWYEINVPFNEFTNGTQDNFDKHSGWLIGPPGDQADETFVFFFTDIALSFEGIETDDDTGEETNPGTGNETSEPKTLYSASGAASDDPETFVSLADFGSGATFDANVTTDTSFGRVFSVTSGEGYGADVHVAFVAFTGYSAGFASGYDNFNVKVKGSPDGRVEIKLIGSGTDSVAEVNVNTYANSVDLGNGWYELTVPISEFSNNSAANIAAHTGWLIGPPGDQADETFVFYFTDAGFTNGDPLPAEPPIDYQLVWANEFSESALNDWNIETGYGPNNDGWGNDESQLYTNSASNISVKDGSLVITAKCDLSVNGSCGKRDGSITSARVTTKDKIEFRYGKIEARIKVPDGTSTWPALWMLGSVFPDTPWPAAGEIDIMEVWQTGGSTINQSHSTIHYDNNGRVIESANTTLTEAVSDDFRVWTMEWNEDSIKFAIDGLNYQNIDITDSKYDAFRESFFLLMNIAIDGTLGGAPDQIVNTPQEMLIDYVRVYQDPENENNIFTAGSDGGNTGEATTPDKVLYSAVSADNDDAETFVSLADFGSGATFDANVTTDTSFDRVFSVTSGEGYGADVHVAFAAFTGHTAGFASGYDSFTAKVKGSPDGRIEIKLIGGTDSVVEVNVNSYTGSTDLGNGWFELDIPFTDFTNNGADNIAAHTGWLIGPPGDQADETFVFYFTDAGFNNADDSTPPATGTTPDKVLYSAVSADNDDAETFVSLADFGSGATFDANVTTDTSFDRVFSVTSGEGYGAGVHVAFAAFTGHSAGFASGYDTFNAKVKGSPDGRVEVKLIGSGTDSVAEVNVNTYANSVDLGNGWYQLNIPFSEFNNNGADNIAAHTGWLIGPPGDQADETFTFFFTDAGFSGS